MLKVIDKKKMRNEGKEICRGYEVFLQLKKDKLGSSESSAETFKIATTAMSRDHEKVILNFRSGKTDMAEAFIEACACIARSDSQAGRFLIYKYYMKKSDDDIAILLSVSSKALNAIKGRAYMLIAYIAGKVYYVEEDSD